MNLHTVDPSVNYRSYTSFTGYTGYLDLPIFSKGGLDTSWCPLCEGNCIKGPFVSSHLRDFFAQKVGERFRYTRHDCHYNEERHITWRPKTEGGASYQCPLCKETY